jgi:hypothetical protein
MEATHAGAKQLSGKVKGCGCKLYMDNKYSSPDCYSDLTEEKINYYGTVSPNHKGMPDDF